MTNAEEAQTGPEIGSRVHVMSADGQEDLGYGKYMGEVPMKDVIEEQPQSSIPDPESSEEASETDESEVAEMIAIMVEKGAMTPRIVLDSGDTVYGFQCFWQEVDEKPDLHAFLESCLGPVLCFDIAAVVPDPENPDRFALNIRMLPPEVSEDDAPEVVQAALESAADVNVAVIVHYFERKSIMCLCTPFELDEFGEVDRLEAMAAANTANTNVERCRAVVIIDKEGRPSAIARTSFVLPLVCLTELDQEGVRLMFRANVFSLVDDMVHDCIELNRTLGRRPVPTN